MAVELTFRDSSARIQISGLRPVFSVSQPFGLLNKTWLLYLETSRKMATTDPKPHVKRTNTAMSQSSKRLFAPISRTYTAASTKISTSISRAFSQSHTPLTSSGSKQKDSKSDRAWKKTKKFLSSLGEPPTAEYDRQQAAKKEIKTSGREAYGAVNYGPYNQGGPFGGRT